MHGHDVHSTDPCQVKLKNPQTCPGCAFWVRPFKVPDKAWRQMTSQESLCSHPARNCYALKENVRPNTEYSGTVNGQQKSLRGNARKCVSQRAMRAERRGEKNKCQSVFTVFAVPVVMGMQQVWPALYGGVSQQPWLRDKMDNSTC